MSDDNLQQYPPPPSGGSIPTDPYGAPGAPGATNIPRKSYVVKTTKPRPHVCATCTRSFARLEHLKRHERSHTKEKPFQCPVCERCFARRDLLLRHQQKLHASYPSGRTKGVRKQSTSGASTTSRHSSSEASTRPTSSRVSFDVRRRVSHSSTSTTAANTGAPVSANSTPSPASSSASSSAVNNPVLKRSSAVRLSSNRRPRAASFSAQTASSYTSIKDAADIRQQLSSLIPLGPSIVDFSTPQLGPTVYMSDIADDVSSLSPNDSTSLSPLFINPALLDSSSFAPSTATPGTPYPTATATTQSTPLSLDTEASATFFPQTQRFGSLSSIPESNNNNNNNNNNNPIHDHLFNSELDDFSSFFSGVDAQYMNFAIDNGNAVQQEQHHHQPHHHHHHHHQSMDNDNDNHVQTPTATSGINFNQDLFKSDYETYHDTYGTNNNSTPQENMAPPPPPPAPGAVFGPAGNEFYVLGPVQDFPTHKSGGENNNYGGRYNNSNGTTNNGQPVTPPLSLSPQTTDSFISMTRDGTAIPTPPTTTASQVHANSNVNPFDRNPALTGSSQSTSYDTRPQHNHIPPELFKDIHDDWSESIFSDNGLLNFDSNHLPQNSQHSVFNLISDDLHNTGLKVTPQIRLHLLASLATPTPFTTISKPQLPSTIELQRFLNAYSRDFDRHLPFIPPTYVFDEDNAPLLLAMAAIGALYEHEPAIARNIFETSRRSIHVYLESRRLRQNVERQSATHTLDPLSIGSCAKENEKETDKVDPTPVWLIQCLILGVIYGLFCGDPVTAEIAVAQTSAVVSLSRSAMLHLPPTNRPQLDQSIKSQWECFVECQTRIRTFHAVHVVSSLLAVDFNIDPALKIEDIGCGSPCDEFLWNARTPEEWSPLLAEYQAQGSTEMAIYGLDIRSVIKSLMECESVDDLHIFPIPGFTIVSLMYGIHHYIQSMQSSREWNSQVMRRKIEIALQGWQAIWSLSPYASVMPSTQYGPMMSDAIWNLNFAKLRLAIDYSRVKELFWSRDFIAMGQAVSELNNAELPWAAFVAAEGVSLFDKQCGQADAKSINRQNFIQLTFLLFDSSLILSEYIRRLEIKIGYESNTQVNGIDDHNLRDLSSTFEGSNDGFVYKNRHMLMKLKDDERALYVGCRDLVLRLLGNLSSSSAIRNQKAAAAAAATAAAEKVNNESGESISPSEQSVIDIYLQLSNLSLSDNNNDAKIGGDDINNNDNNGRQQEPATLSRLLVQTVAVALESSIVWPIMPVMAQALRLRCDQLSQPPNVGQQQQKTMKTTTTTTTTHT